MATLVHRTLLIDDSDTDLFIQRRFLEVYEFSKELLMYKSAAEALDWLRDLDGERTPDVIFLDLNMPDIDGFTFLKSFSELPAKSTAKSRIVVLTSSNSAYDRQQVLENKHVIQFITKPLKQDDIESLKQLIAASPNT